MADYETLDIFKTRCDLELELSHYTKELRDITPMPSLNVANVWEGNLGLMEHVLVDFPNPRRAHLVNSFVVDLHDESQKYHIIKKNVSPFRIGHSTSKNKFMSPVKENKSREDRKENIPHYNVPNQEATTEEYCDTKIGELPKANIKLSERNDIINKVDRCSYSMQSVKRSQTTEVAKLELDKKVKPNTEMFDQNLSSGNQLSDAVQEVTTCTNSTNSDNSFTQILKSNCDTTTCPNNISTEGSSRDNSHQTHSTGVAVNSEKKKFSENRKVNIAAIKEDIHSHIQKFEECKQFLKNTAIQLIDQFESHFQEIKYQYEKQLRYNR